MKIGIEELAARLVALNSWWHKEQIADLPNWRRAAFKELYSCVKSPLGGRATFLSGARQIGKTTLIMQAIDHLIKDGIPPGNILYATFDDPFLKLAGIDVTIKAWRQHEPKQDGTEYVFLDEVQFIPDWGTWVKHQVDFNKQRRIIFTGSATPIIGASQESGLGRWHTIKLTTLSFYEYVQLKRLNTPQLPSVKSLKEIFDWSERDLSHVREEATPYIAHFHEYLIRGGFPQTVMMDSIDKAQKLLREDIIDKALKRDMTVMFGVRLVLELEQIFLYICLHDGGMLDMSVIESNIGVKRPTAQKFIELLEAAHLIFRMQPFGYGKEVLRGKWKVYLSDQAIASAVMWRNKNTLDSNPQLLGVAAESAVLKHLFARYYSQNVRFSYWHGKKDLEVDLVAEINGETIPFEVKYRSQHTSLSDCKGLEEFCSKRKIQRGYIVTKSLDDFGAIKQNTHETSFLKIPALLLCYFMGEMEVTQKI